MAKALRLKLAAPKIAAVALPAAPSHKSGKPYIRLIRMSHTGRSAFPSGDGGGAFAAPEKSAGPAMAFPGGMGGGLGAAGGDAGT